MVTDRAGIGGLSAGVNMSAVTANPEHFGILLNTFSALHYQAAHDTFPRDAFLWHDTLKSRLFQ